MLLVSGVRTVTPENLLPASPIPSTPLQDAITEIDYRDVDIYIRINFNTLLKDIYCYQSYIRNQQLAFNANLGYRFRLKEPSSGHTGTIN
jgi:hypothetical protein